MMHINRLAQYPPCVWGDLNRGFSQWDSPQSCQGLRERGPSSLVLHMLKDFPEPFLFCDLLAPHASPTVWTPRAAPNSRNTDVSRG